MTWARTLTPEQRAAVSAVLPRDDQRMSGGNTHYPGMFSQGGANSPFAGWSVLMMPSTGTPTELEVLHRDISGRLIERIPIMQKGRFCTPSQ